MRKSNSLLAHVDWPLLASFFVLLFFGIATVYSVSFSEEHPNIFSLSEKYGKQMIWLGISLFLGLIIFLIDASIYVKYALLFYSATVVMLIIVLFMPPINGARAWIGIGSMGIQPAEFAKISTSLLLAKYISELIIKQQTIKTVLYAVGILFIPSILVAAQPDAGTLIVFSSFLFVLYREGLTFDPIILRLLNSFRGLKFKSTWIGSHFIPVLFVFLLLFAVTLKLNDSLFELWFFPNIKISGVLFIVLILATLSILSIVFFRIFSTKRDRPKILLVIILGFLILSSLVFLVNTTFNHLAKHQKNRIELVLGMKEDPNGNDYNRNRAMAAVGSGGLTGKGYKKASVSSVRSNHVPESETDFIFCPFAEEWGFGGSIVLILVYLFMVLRILFIAERQRSVFIRVYAYCVAMILFYHFAINIGMNIGLAPVIGIPLPFFSYGGSSVISFSIMIFLLLKLDSNRMDVLR